MQGAGVSIPDGVTSLRLYRAAGAWMRDELSYFVREEEREAWDHLISAEYLPGRLFEEMARSLGVWDTVDRVARQYGYSAKQIADREKEMSLGSGTPGKCAVQILKKGWRGAPVGGYGICYTKGWFRQRIVDGEQVELQERWLEDHPLIESNQKEAVEVFFGGTVEEIFTEIGMKVAYRDRERVAAVPYDVWLPREGNRPAARLRLWRAQGSLGAVSPDRSQEEYLRQIQERDRQNAITGKLYPEDVGEEGRMLRLYQAYFLVSASLQDVRRRKGEGEEICLNGTLTALAIPEWMRLCMDEDGMSWEDACADVRQRLRSVAYEGAEEVLLDGEQVRLILPRIHAILTEILRRHPQSGIFRDGNIDLSALLRWAQEAGTALSYAEFCGFSPTAWTRFGNGGFSHWADRHLGEGWRRDPTLFGGVDRFADGSAGKELLEQKQRCREDLVAFLRARQETVPDEDKALFVLTGSVTERHRTLLALLRMLYYADRARAGAFVPPICLLLGGKAPPSDALGKEILRFAWHLGWELRGDPVCRERLQVVVVENYNGRASEVLLPAADVFEHLTLPGMGGVGTDAHAALSLGGILLSTRNGMASLQAEGAGGAVLFGMTGEEVEKTWREGYRAIHYLRTDPALRMAVSRLSRRIYGAEFPQLYDYLTQSGGRVADPYFCLADLASYVAATEETASLLADAGERAKRMLSAVGGLSEWMRGYA